MKKFLVIYSILLYAFSCAGMDQQDPAKAFIAAAAHGDHAYLQSIVERCDISQEMLDQAGTAAMENGHLDIAQFLHTQRPALQKDKDTGTPEQDPTKAFIAAAAHGDHAYLQSIVESCDIPQEILDQAGTAAIENGHLDIAQFLHSQRPSLQEDACQQHHRKAAQDRCDQVLEEQLAAIFASKESEDVQLQQARDLLPFSAERLLDKFISIMNRGNTRLAELLYKVLTWLRVRGTENNSAESYYQYNTSCRICSFMDGSSQKKHAGLTDEEALEWARTHYPMEEERAAWIQEVLEERRCSPNIIATAYDMAVCIGELRIINLLRRYHAVSERELYTQEVDPEHMLLNAIRDGRLDDAQELLASGPRISQECLNTALNIAISTDQATTVQWLFDNVEYPLTEIYRIHRFALDKHLDEFAQRVHEVSVATEAKGYLS